MVGIRLKSSGSWLDPECAGLLGWKFGKRLWQRCKGQRGVFITLTYRRDEYPDSLELYRRQSERQDVPLFLRRLGRALRRSFKGRWVCKMEFQQGGWVHWHIILLGDFRIDREFQALIAKSWGHGFIWLKPLTKTRIYYTCKYVAKGGDVPGWIYGERPRSVKIVRVSPGFWGEPSRPSSAGDFDYRKYGPQPQRIDVYAPIGERLRVMKGVVIKAACKTFSLSCDPAKLIARVTRVLGSSCGTNGKWILWKASLAQADAFAAACRSAAVPSAAPPPGREAALHLRGTSNPDVVPGWLERWYRWDAEQASPEACYREAMSHAC